MTALEDRLREELPLLADELTAGVEAAIDESASAIVVSPEDEPDSRTEEWAPLVRRPVLGRRGDRRWPRLATAAAAAVLIVGAAVGVAIVDGDEPSEVAASGATAPANFGTWTLLPDAPIDSRSYAVKAWTGDEAVFWAGSSLSRGLAHTDGAAYDPDTDSWRTITVPGWGHPGLTSAFFDGELYALAKGGGTRFDPLAGTWADLAPVTGMFLAATVATDQGVWGLGPVSVDRVGQPDLGIARYLPETDEWDYRPVYEGTPEQATIVHSLSSFNSTVHWDGSEIIVWGASDGGIAFDPATETWRTIEPPPGRTTAEVTTSSLAVATDEGLAVVMAGATGDGPDASEPATASVAVLRPDGWREIEATIPIARRRTISIAAAGEWLVVFSADEAPAMVHLPSGAWSRREDGPLGGVEAPNTVWTGDQLVVWGGFPTDPDDRLGASWKPPDS